MVTKVLTPKKNELLSEETFPLRMSSIASDIPHSMVLKLYGNLPACVIPGILAAMAKSKTISKNIAGQRSSHLV